MNNLLILWLMCFRRVAKVSLDSNEGFAELRKSRWSQVKLSQGCERPAGLRWSFHKVVKVPLGSNEAFTEWWKSRWSQTKLSRSGESLAGVRWSFHGVVKVSFQSAETFTRWWKSHSVSLKLSQGGERIGELPRLKFLLQLYKTLLNKKVQNRLHQQISFHYTLFRPIQSYFQPMGTCRQ